MKRRRVEFRLGMPNVGSWNGRWSGDGKNYVIVRSLREDRIRELEIPRTWFHRWEDGWCASVAARVMDPGERRQKSDGFHGYDWMVASIVRCGEIRYEEER